MLPSASRFRIVATAALAALCACAGSLDNRVTLHPEAAHVELVAGSVEGCQTLGDVIGSASVEGDEQQATLEARNDVRNRAASLGATHVALQTNSGEKKAGMWRARYQITLAGVAYRCAR